MEQSTKTKVFWFFNVFEVDQMSVISAFLSYYEAIIFAIYLFKLLFIVNQTDRNFQRLDTNIWK